MSNNDPSHDKDLKEELDLPEQLVASGKEILLRFKPSKKIYVSWLLNIGIFSLVLFGTAYGISYAIFAELELALISIVLFSLMIGGGISSIILIPFVVYYVFLYRSIWYIVTNEEIIVQRGVIFHTIIVAPFAKITNVNISRGPVEQILGLGTVKIEVAGLYMYGLKYTPRINGITNYKELSDLISSKLREYSMTLTAAAEQSIRKQIKTKKSKLEILQDILLELEKI